VAHRLALLPSHAPDVERALLTPNRPGPLALGTGLLLAQGVGLLFQEGLQGAFGEPGGGGVSELLHGVEIDVASGAVVAEGASGNDVAPLCREVLELLQLFGCEGAMCPDASCVAVKTRSKAKVDLVRLWRRT
jgi:hypothetical protein